MRGRIVSCQAAAHGTLGSGEMVIKAKSLLAWVKSMASDYEHGCLSQSAAIDARGMIVQESCPIGPARELKHYQRRVCWADFVASSSYLPEVSPDFPDTFVGSLLFSLSVASFADLKTHGTTTQRYIQPDEQQQQFLDTDIHASFNSDGASTFRLIVNDKVVEIPTIEAASIKQNEIVRIKVLDDARFAIPECK